MREKKQKKKNKAMQNKVTVGEFFGLQVKIFRELWDVYPWATIGIILLSGVRVCTGVVELKLLEYVTDRAARYLGGSRDGFEVFCLVIAGFFGLLLIFRIIDALYLELRERYQSAIVCRSEQKLQKKLSRISYEYYESNQFHEKINLAKKACDQYGNAVYGVTTIFRIVLMLIIYSFMLAKLSIWFVAVVLAAIVFSSVIAASVTDRQLDFWRTHVSPETRRNSYFRGVYGNRVQQAAIQTGRAFSYFSEKYGYYNQRERKNYIRLNLLSFSSELLTSMMFLVTFGVTALAVGKGVAAGTYGIGYYSMVVAMVASLFQTIKSFTLFMMNQNWYVRVLGDYYEVLDFEESGVRENSENDGMRTAPRGEQFDSENDGMRTAPRGEQFDSVTDGMILLQGLRYRYPQAQACALEQVDITFRRGEKIALVGLNGSGKTTMISVILGLLEKYEGIKEVNGAKVTAVLQDFGQYQMSIKENIEIGCGGKQLPDEEVAEILRQVGLEEFAASSPDGIYTKLGQLENGVELSKGQWQRLAIGRLLANKEANVWILDEPTAYLDPVAEVEMYKFIFGLAGDRLVFFISHRLGFAQMADRIVVVDHGGVAEDGSHTELMARQDGIYAAMFQAQREWYA